MLCNTEKTLILLWLPLFYTRRHRSLSKTRSSSSTYRGNFNVVTSSQSHQKIAQNDCRPHLRRTLSLTDGEEHLSSPVVSTMARRQTIRPESILQLLLVFFFVFVVSTLSLFRRWETTPSVGLPLSLETYLDGRQREDNDATAPRIHSTAINKKISSETQKLPPRHTATVSAETKKEFPNESRHRDDGVTGMSRNDTLSAANVTSAVNRDVSLEKMEILTRDMATASTKKDESPRRHYPEYFSKEVPLESLMERGNVLTVHTGCSIATWSYQGKRHLYRPLNDCRQHAKNADALRVHVVTPETAPQVEEYDSIYVPIVKLEHFVNETLPHIQNDFVLMSGQNSLPPEPIPRRVYDVIMEHSRIVRWFLQNLPIHAYDPHHPKLVPFPYGIHPLQPAAILAEMKNNVTRDNFIYLSWFKMSNNMDARQHIPIGERVETDEYFRRMHQSTYVLSPDGDRPECHRHYEAIALGTMPITSLNPRLYRHLQGNVIFEEHQWNLTELQERLSHKPETNQRLIFEEYWMEYVERIVGRPMRWWDPSRDVRCLLEEISGAVKNIALQRRPNELLADNNKGANVEHASQENVARTSSSLHGKTESQEMITLVSNTSTLVKGTHEPSFFSDIVPLEKLIARKNLLSVYTGCSICTWSFDGFDDPQDTHNDCLRYKGWESFLMHHLAPDKVFQIEAYDSIYVPIAGLEQFVNDILPNIETNVILVSGQRANVPLIPKEHYDTLIEHPRIVRWFLQNLSVYAYDARHPKLSPFPYGLATKNGDEYLAEMQRNKTKDNSIFVSFFTKKNNMAGRNEVPRSMVKVTAPEYFESMHQSQYVLSPNGDRPECHRHYEAIGMGTMPITSLDVHVYRHLQGNAVFDEQAWNMTELEKRLPRNPVVNRRLIFEEYWMEYVERIVGRPMRWWDPSRNVRCSLEEIAEIVRSAPSMGEIPTEVRVIDESKSAPNPRDKTEFRERVALVSSTTKSIKAEAHHPSYFSDEVPLEKLVERSNLLTVFTGCNIATFSFDGELHPEDVHKDCQRYNGLAAYKKKRVTNDTVSQVQPYDSIYVTIEALGPFIDSILPHIETDFVLLTGQNSNVSQIPKDRYNTLIEHPRIVRWFLQNLSVYAHDAQHPKLRPFPYGIFTRHTYQYLREMLNNDSKDNFIYAGFVRKQNNFEARKDIPIPKKKLRDTEYWRLMHKSQYVLSPDGDRPECHRHYEAIGMGTMPITSLDPYLHRHLKGNVVFGEKRWNMTELEARLPRDPAVNRRLIFEEYWMEYVERIVGRPMRWWDPSRFGVRCSLEEIANIVKNSTYVSP